MKGQAAVEGKEDEYVTMCMLFFNYVIQTYGLFE